MRHTALGAIGEISTPEKEWWLGLNKMIDGHNTLSEGHERFFIYRQYASIEIDIAFRQLCDEAVDLAGWSQSQGPLSLSLTSPSE